MAEALILALVGGTVGVLLASAGVPLVVRTAPENIPRLGTVGMLTDVLAWAAVEATGMRFPDLFAELIRRGWSDSNLAKLAGGNVLRALRGAEAVARDMRNIPPSMAKLP